MKFAEVEVGLAGKEGDSWNGISKYRQEPPRPGRNLGIPAMRVNSSSQRGWGGSRNRGERKITPENKLGEGEH